MKKRILIPASAACLGALVAAACTGNTPTTSATPPAKAAQDLHAYKVASAPTMDGKLSEEGWTKASAATIKVYGGDNASAQTVTMKSLYDAEYIYFAIEVPDPTKSLRRQPYKKNEDGTWTKVPADAAGTDKSLNAYEDKFSILWDMNTTGFKEQGCAVTCHVTATPRALKYTNKAGEKVDMWHIKNARNSWLGFVDDQYTDDTSDVNVNKGAGRKTDPTASGKAYVDIALKNGVPEYTAASSALTGDKKWVIDLRDTATISVDPNLPAGTELPSIAVNTYTGDSADLPGKFVYDETAKKWTYEFKRKLNTNSQYDVQFTDLKKAYPFGVAIFDNTQIGHGTQKDVSNLTFLE